MFIFNPANMSAGNNFGSTAGYRLRSRQDGIAHDRAFNRSAIRVYWPR